MRINTDSVLLQHRPSTSAAPVAVVVTDGLEAVAATRTASRIAALEQRDLVLLVAAGRLRFSLNCLVVEHAGRRRGEEVAAVVNRVLPTVHATGARWSVRVAVHAPAASAGQAEARLVAHARRAGAEVLVVPDSWRSHLAAVRSALLVVPAVPLAWDGQLDTPAGAGSLVRVPV